MIYYDRGCLTPEARGITDDHSKIQDHPLKVATSPTQRRTLARPQTMA